MLFHNPLGYTRQNHGDASKVQGDQLNMVVFLVPCIKCPLYACTVAYTGKITFYKVTDKHGHVNLVMLYLLYTNIIYDIIIYL